MLKILLVTLATALVAIVIVPATAYLLGFFPVRLPGERSRHVRHRQ